MQRYAKAFAWFTGNEKVGMNQLKTVAPYLFWHKIQPTQKALTENPKYGNDRIAFVNTLVEKIETDYDELRDSKARKVYSAALNAIEKGRIGDRTLTDVEIRNVTKNAIEEIGKVDRPWAISLASHVASAYNIHYNGNKAEES